MSEAKGGDKDVQLSTMAHVSSMSEYPANVGMDVERESIEMAMAEHDKDALLTPNSSSPKPPPRVISITHGDVLRELLKGIGLGEHAERLNATASAII